MDLIQSDRCIDSGGWLAALVDSCCLFITDIVDNLHNCSTL